MATERVEHRFTAMGGPCLIRLEHQQDIDVQACLVAAQQEVQRLEVKYSRYRSNSLVSQINRAAGCDEAVPIDSETAALLNYAETAWQASDGLFDLTSGVLRHVWDFASGQLPESNAVERILPLVGWQYVQWTPTSVYLPKRGMELDFGGCVKEYAADSVVSVLRESGVSAALIDLAGDIAVLGTPSDSVGWPVGIRHPRRSHDAIASVVLSRGALASSGDYERCITINGERYGHLLSPRTGWPVRGLVAVSVLAPQCLVAGSSATIALLQEQAVALQWLDDLGLPWLAIDQDMRCHGSLNEGA